MLGLLCGLSACAGRGPVLAPRLAQGAAAPAVELHAVPFFAQQDYQCGPAALATVLHHAGRAVRPEDLTAQVYLPAKQGSLQLELIAASRRHGRVAYPIDPQLDALLAQLQAGHPVLVLQNLALALWPQWHYAVVIGYDPATDVVVLRSGIERRLLMPARRFLATWRRADYWGLVVLEPGTLPARVDVTRYLQAVAPLESQGKYAAAAAAYQAAVDRWPGHALSRLGLGNARYGQGRLRAAEQQYRAVLALQKDHVLAGNNLGQVLAEQGCYEQALRVIDDVAATYKGPLTAALQQTRAEVLRRRVEHPMPAASCASAATP